MNKKIKYSIIASALFATNINAQDLGAITVIGATKTEQSIKDVTADIDVITGVELEEKHINTVQEALELVSGVNFTNNGGLGATTNINLRGSSNNRTMILVDGVRFKDHSSINGTDISSLMITDIEKIEVIKGAQSGIWGADASAGVINIITKTPKLGTHGSILAEAGSFNTKKLGATISHKNKQYELKFGATKITSDSFTTKAPYGDNINKYEDDAYKNTTLNLQGAYNLNDDAKVKLNIIKIDSLKDYDSSSPDDTTMQNDSKTKIYNLAYEQHFKQHDMLVKFDTANIKRDQIGTTWGVKLTDNTNNNLEAMDKITYNKKDFFIVGAGTTKDKLDYTKADDTKADASNSSKYIYATNSNFIDKLILTQSIRYDDYDNFNNKATGKVGAKYNLDKQNFLFANAGTSYSVPLLIKNINPWGSENLDIKPEQSKSYDIGMKIADVKLTYFYQIVTDLIDWYDPTPTNYYNNDAVYKNLDGESTFRGIEVEYNKDITTDTLFSCSFTSLSAKDQDGKELARKSHNTLKFGVDYYGIDKFHFGLNGEHIGTRYDKADKQGTQTGRYTIANLVVNYDLAKTVKIYGKIDNITNKYYQTVDGYATSPRAFYAGVKVSF